MNEKEPAITYETAQAIVKLYFSPLQFYREDAAERLVRTLQQIAISVGHAEETAKQFDQDCPTPRELMETALTLRAKFEPPKPSLQEQWKAAGYTNDPDATAAYFHELTGGKFLATKAETPKAQSAENMVKIPAKAREAEMSKAKPLNLRCKICGEHMDFDDLIQAMGHMVDNHPLAVPVMFGAIINYALTFLMEAPIDPARWSRNRMQCHLDFVNDLRSFVENDPNERVRKVIEQNTVSPNVSELTQ